MTPEERTAMRSKLNTVAGVWAAHRLRDCLDDLAEAEKAIKRLSDARGILDMVHAKDQERIAELEAEVKAQQD